MSERHQILFVDDDLMVLNGLKRLMRSMRDAWDARFADGGERAIGMLQDKPAHVVVSDMRMPGMNGAELLTAVMARWPETVRFVLSGYADRELISQCIGASHQFLAKPCEPEMLKRLIQRAVEVRERVGTPAILRLVAGMTCLPSPPEIYRRLARELRLEDPSIESVGAIISQDPALSAKMLQIVNSAFFGLSRNIDSPAEAVARLGVETCRSLARALGVCSEPAGAPGTGCPVCPSIWKHSIGTALGAKAICEEERVDPRVTSKAYTAGLLVDCGQLILLERFPELYPSVLEASLDSGPGLCAHEKEKLEANHAEVGGHLLSIWGLPAEIVDTVVRHHQPAPSAEPGFSVLAAVHAADSFAREMATDGTGQTLNNGYLEQIGVGDRIATWRQVVHRKLQES